MDAWGWDELQPWHGRGVLGQEADQLAAGARRAHVAGAPVAEGRRLDLEDRNPDGASDVHGVVARARVNDQDVKTHLLRETAASTSPSQRAPSLDRDDFGRARRGLAKHSPSVPAGHRAVTSALAGVCDEAQPDGQRAPVLDRPPVREHPLVGAQRPPAHRRLPSERLRQPPGDAQGVEGVQVDQLEPCAVDDPRQALARVAAFVPVALIEPGS